MSKHAFAPEVAPITKAVWQLATRLHPQTHPTANLNWAAYVRSGGPARYIAAPRKKVSGR